jgi:hypothetical protein
MSNIVNPLQLLINQAASAKPSRAMQTYRERLNPKSSGNTVILLDISGSMSEVVGSKRKIDILRQAVDRQLLINEVVLVFSSGCDQVASFQLIPEPFGGTAMHLGLQQASFYSPSHTLVVSDGQPDCQKQAFKEAEMLPGTISTLYIGNDKDLNAVAFMSKLARVGCGRFEVCNIHNLENQKKLGSVIKGLLPSN